MKTMAIGTGGLSSSRLAYGCWRIVGDGSETARARGKKAILAAVEAGYTLFDHADIYADGHAETLFGEVLRETPGLRRQILLASKCGIRKAGDSGPEAPYRYDFSASHIVRCCEESLRRLGVDTIDLYQLHRPDYLGDPAEVAEAFDKLRQSGKAREFGVSNFRPAQLAALQRACPMPLVVNQVEISLACLTPFDDGTLDQCLAEKITPLAWSPLAGGLLGDGAARLLPAQETYRPQGIVTALANIAPRYGISPMALALAWLLRHPAGIIPIIGSTRPERIREAVQADAVSLSREDWYRLFEAARGGRLP